MRVGRFVERTWTEGPGPRFTIWVQGCPIHCPGCYAEALQDPDGGFEIPPDQVIGQIRQIRSQLEGITLLGGEPFSQAAALSAIAAAAQEMGLSVLTFTGFLYEDILSHGTSEQRALLSHTDVLLDGPYRETMRDFSRPLLGSTNQRYIFLSDRYSHSEILGCKNKIELRVDRDGKILLNGMGDFQALEEKLQRNAIVKGDRTYAIYRF